MKIFQFITLIFIWLGLTVLAFGQQGMTMHDNKKSLKPISSYHAESLYQVPAKWVTQNGDTVQLADYEGQPLMLVMFYGRCTGTCPVLIQRTWALYSELDQQIRDQLQVMAVSFDTERDTPEALKAYAEYEQLDIPGWNFVTGHQTDVRELAMLLGVQYRQRSDGHFEHSNLITVLDKDGRIAVRSEGITGALNKEVAAIETLFERELQ